MKNNRLHINTHICNVTADRNNGIMGLDLRKKDPGNADLRREPDFVPVPESEGRKNGITKSISENNESEYISSINEEDLRMAKKILAAQRQQKIVEMLKEDGSVKLAELAETFQVSRETIRRDLIHLNETGAITRSYGGAVNNMEFHSIPVAEKINTNQDVKYRICRKALEYIPEGSVLYLDAGSTVSCLASLLGGRSDLTIITNSLSAVNALTDTGCQVYVAGGQFNARNLSFEGLQTARFLETIKVGIAFLGSTGFAHHQGPTTIDFMDSQVKQTIIGNAQRKIVLADSTKSRSTALNEYAKWRDIDLLITDSGIEDAMREELGRYTEVLTV